ncbi:unnamed protein product [Urochloa decumbens]|uniref:Protein kinase domain-containing protein n=1 Tax=Urochloa decumbens TaxID=240449 RepID=A0ABC9C3A5_9POAL
MPALPIAVTVTLLQLAAAATVAAAAGAPIALPGCQSRCGELDIPYPFGTTAGCYRPGFKVTCDPKPGAGVAQRLKLGNNGDGPAVLEISVENSTVRVRSTTWFFAVGNTSMARLAVVSDGYMLNPKRNLLVHIGCGFRVSSWTTALGKHSECVDSTGNALGYVCRCSGDYQGNPYVRDGCRRPRRRLHLSAGIIFGMGVGIGIFLLFLAIVTIFATKSFEDRKAKKMREFLFKQNRGLLLQQLVDKDIAERMIFSLEELEKATNKFDKARILGGGGHGTVYKGILSNQHVVAIKMSKLVIRREIDGFINEVAILSQINHRNVVKLFGCCLETEAPLLVYEFIPNGTLYAHLHVDGPTSLPWKDRLRIAFEVATSLAYLHSSASISIVHRDIKSSNILLDDRLTAKVSDFGASRGITIDESRVTTAVQGTYGYLDPEYYYTRRLTEKSDVYSYGVMLVELLTRKKPTTDMSQDDVSLVAHFIQLLSKDSLSEILDVQVIEEGEEEAKQVAALAALCVQMKGNDRPTMRHVEMRLQGIQSPNNNFQSDPGVQGLRAGLSSTRFEGGNNIVVHDNNSRRSSMKREILLSATLPR